MNNDDLVVSRGTCAACSRKSERGNPVFSFPYWKLDLCKMCFIQLNIAQLEELQQEVKDDKS